MLEDDHECLHSRLLGGACELQNAQFAYLVHELNGVDHEPRGSVILNLLGYRGGLKNGCITIDFSPGQVVAGYIEFVAEETSELRSARRRKNVDHDEDEEG